MKTLATFLLISLLAGCVTIQSNIKSDAIPTFKRILVVTKLRKAPESYVQGFVKSFPVTYEVCTVALSPLSFDNPDEAVRKQAEACQSDVILTLELSKTGHSSRYNSVPYEYNAEMSSVATGQPFWKAIISSNPTYGERVPPRSVVKRLLKDHIIEGKLPESLQALN
ncbi:hypothetical protein G8759_07245 [Spirosoma aureum]|uniref:Lipoprotein n=1 Tax=Spirosoma aureum TaxID=2692134 RepID=A0A6G9AJI4_9BACT|nr:hypothetical protein [Spirosoma aureum]QIP12435.1 hypothetical protein G8759_07245 [Spirosoma aureum]